VFFGNRGGLLTAVLEAFKDVLFSQNVYFQIEDNSWGKEAVFLDVLDQEIPDRAVIRVSTIAESYADSEVVYLAYMMCLVERYTFCLASYSSL